MRIAIIGASGLVGREFLKIIRQRNFPADDLVLYATSRSAGMQIEFCGKTLTIIELSEGSLRGVDLALFSAGAGTAKVWAPKFAQLGALVVDNSSAFRMNEDVPLVVPEVNPEAVKLHSGIIANPNCSTIGMVAALHPLHKAFGLKSIVVTSFQSVSGGGRKSLNEMLEQTKDPNVKPSAFPRKIAFNAIPQIGDFLPSGETSEERKFREEARKIMAIPHLEVVPCAVRVPVEVGHSLSIFAQFEKSFDLEAAKTVVENRPGLILSQKDEDYPTPLQIAGRDEVFIGRMRIPQGFANALNMWVVSDNVRKGAALNAIQIAELAFNL